MAVDGDVLDRIRERLRVSTRVGDDRIQVAARDDDVVLLGAVASPEEATVAGQLAEQYAASVVNELQVDQGLREGLERPAAGEPATPAADEVLVGSTDMLAGPDSTPTEDLAEALDENEPWSPPDVPQLAPTATEQRGGVPAADRLALSEWEEAAGDPEAKPPAAETGGYGEDMVEQVPGTAKGEPTTWGGALGGTPALETGAIGADTAPSDAARDASGGGQKVAGTDRGPAAPEDRAVRQEIEEG
jgi:BON domain